MIVWQQRGRHQLASDRIKDSCESTGGRLPAGVSINERKAKSEPMPASVEAAAVKEISLVRAS
jgi:hypothetical protein